MCSLLKLGLLFCMLTSKKFNCEEIYTKQMLETSIYICQLNLVKITSPSIPVGWVGGGGGGGQGGVGGGCIFAICHYFHPFFIFFLSFANPPPPHFFCVPIHKCVGLLCEACFLHLYYFSGFIKQCALPCWWDLALLNWPLLLSAL